MNPQQPPYGHFPNPYAGMSPQMLQMQQYQAAMLLQQQQRMPFAFQPLYNHSSMMSMPPPTRYQQQPQRFRGGQGYQGVQQEYREGSREALREPQESREDDDLEILASDADHVAEAKQINPKFLETVDKNAVNSVEPNVFQIDQEMYPLGAWKRVDPRLATRQQYSQWFNYGLTPRTWAQYAQMQRKIQQRLKEEIL
jgi:hypothetical protein